MNRILRSSSMLASLVALTAVNAQTRYIDEVFTPAEVTLTSDVTYGVNIDFMTSDLASAQTPTDIVALQTFVATNQTIPAAYFDPTDVSTAVKVRAMKMDVYQPDQAVDPLVERPVVVLCHTGNLLPPPLNGSPVGTKTDSSLVELANRFARRGYVAVTVENRHGWVPIAATVEERRGTLLNAVYRAIHDVKQAVRTLREDQATLNTYEIDPTKFVIMGEGTGGYMAIGYATLDDPAELFVTKFLPDPLAPSVSYIDTTLVGNIHGFNGQLNLYKDNGYNADIQMCINMGGALADTSWLEPGDVPMVSFHSIFDPFAPFDDGDVIVPTTGEQVVPIQGSNIHIQIANNYGNNDVFATLPDDAHSAVARSFYGTTQSHGIPVTISSTPEGLYPFLRPQWPAPALEEASPWQWWDPNSALAQTVIDPVTMLTAHLASMASNPDMSAAKGRTYIDTIMGYATPRIVCALSLGPCSLVGIDEADPIAIGVSLYPNPATNNVNIQSDNATIRLYEVFDIQGRVVAGGNVNATQFTVDSENLAPGRYLMSLQFDEGKVARIFVVE